MTATSTPAPTNATPHPEIVRPVARAATEPASLLRDAIELTKPRVTRLVVITVGVGFGVAALATAPLASLLTPIVLGTGLAALVGAGLSAAGASALNCWAERRRDALMRRTASRALAAGRVSPGVGLAIGLGLSLVGVGLLLAVVNWAAAAVAAATIASYVLLYTPLKPVTPLSTLVGAVPGALPPLIGWTAAYAAPSQAFGLDHPGGWSLFAIMFVWQVPHTLAIAWRHREDYARGGHLVLPVLDPAGHRTALAILLWTIALLPVSLAPTTAMPGLVGWGYTAVAVLLGLGAIALAVLLVRRRTAADATAVFVASIIHLPILLIALLADAVLTRLA